MEKYKPLALRFGLFAFILLIIYPIIFMFFANIHYIWGFRAGFIIQKLFKIAAISVLILLFLIGNKVDSFKLKFRKKESFIFAALAILLICFSFQFQSDFNNMVKYGFSVHDDLINYDGNKIFGLKYLGDSSTLFMDAVADKDFSVQKYVVSEDLLPGPESDITLSWYSMWRGQTDELNSNFILKVNNKSYLINDLYNNVPPGQAYWFKTSLKADDLNVGQNIFEFTVQGNDSIIFGSQDVYQSMNDFIVSNEINGVSQSHDRTFLIGAFNEPSFFKKLFFKLTFLSKLLSVIFLFISIFGLDFSRVVLSKLKPELFFSTIFAYWVYIFSEWVKSQWEFFASTVANVLFFMYNLFGFEPVMFTSPDGMDWIGINGFVAGIADVCSGVDSLGFFTLAYFFLIVFHWNKLSFWKSLIFFIIGFVLVFMLNIIRVFILLLMGAHISITFAVNAFHTNLGMVLSLAFLLVYLPIVLKYASKKKTI